jgi:hypothetical protein
MALLKALLHPKLYFSLFDKKLKQIWNSTMPYTISTLKLINLTMYVKLKWY